MQYFLHKKQQGTTLIETLIAAAIFVVFSLAIYQLYAKVVELSTRIRTKTVATQIASEQIEFVRNLQYSNVGVVAGIPSGVVSPSKSVVRNGVTFVVSTTIRNIDYPADGTLGGTPNDMSPADNKLATVEVTCTSCSTPVSVEYTTAIAPKNLETENGNGALVIKAINASGVPVENAVVTVQNTSLSPQVNFTDTTDATGTLTIVDAPPSTEKYRISVTKSGYSTEQTFLRGVSGNPDPVKPHITVAANTVSQSTFSIDELSSTDLRAQSSTCSAITGVSGTLTGAKLIGTPSVVKTTIPFTLTNPSNTINNIEWDTYKVALSGNTYDIAGTNPVFPVSIIPNSSQTITLTLKPGLNNRLVVAVIDASNLPIAAATVTITPTSGSPYTRVTNVGSVTQTDWSGGSGQTLYTDQTKFASSSGGVSTTSPAGTIKLFKTGSVYSSSATIESSSIDLGSASTFEQLTWFPSTQVSGIGATPVRFQVATNNDNATWAFKGPDGTNTTYYTNPVSDIAALHDGNQYFRYKLFLSTTDTSKTPTIEDIALTYTSGCLPPGQIDVGGLSSGDYTISVSKTGYATTSKTITMNSDTYETIQLNP